MLDRRLEGSDEKQTKSPRYAPLLSFSRFGPGSITLLLIIALIAVALYLSGHAYFAAISGAFGLLLFGVKSMEIIQLSHPEARKLIGQRCVGVKQVGKGKMGIVQVYGLNDRLDPELWSAESEHEIREGQKAEVTGIRSVVLLIRPCTE